MSLPFLARPDRPAESLSNPDASSVAVGRYWLGCSGWSYEDWVGPFYPPGTPAADFLPRYARVFRTVEVDSSFYRPPSPFLVRRWASVTPEGFRFALKVPRDVTHPTEGIDAREVLERFLLGLEPLRRANKLGPIVLQFAASFRASEAARLADLLGAIPHELALAVELRHGSWWTEETRRRLADRGAALVWSVVPTTRPPPWVTGDFLYARFIGDRALSKFDRIQRDRRKDLEAMRDLFDREGRAATSVFAFSNNHFMGFGPGTTAELAEILGEDRPDLGAAARDPGQRRLDEGADPGGSPG